MSDAFQTSVAALREDTTPVRQALYRDVIGWQWDLGDIALRERPDPLGGSRRCGRM